MKKRVMAVLGKLREDEGQGVAEYVIILAVIVIAAIVLAIAFHDQLAAVWGSVTSQLGDLA
jgi:Flp pilus assembly pilin Flp